METVRRDTGPQDIPFQTVENYQGKLPPKAEKEPITFDDSSIFPKADCQLFQQTVHHIKAWQTTPLMSAVTFTTDQVLKE